MHLSLPRASVLCCAVLYGLSDFLELLESFSGCCHCWQAFKRRCHTVEFHRLLWSQSQSRRTLTNPQMGVRWHPPPPISPQGKLLLAVSVCCLFIFELGYPSKLLDIDRLNYGNCKRNKALEIRLETLEYYAFLRFTKVPMVSCKTSVNNTQNIEIWKQK